MWEVHGAAYRPGMAASSIAVLAGITSTVIFAASALPMLVKAWRTRDLASYSRGNIVLSNIGNAVHSVYVFSMPAGPIWLLHSFYIVTSVLMLIWSLRYSAPTGLSSPERHNRDAETRAHLPA
jgi:uncharacterized protein with PQ loop repeat